MRRIDKIVIHCSASPNGRGDDIHDVDIWHEERKFKRAREWRIQWQPDIESCGYHYVIPIDGTIQYGRHNDEVGAHAQGYNQHSIGICMIGTDEFTAEQWNSLAELVAALKWQFPAADILGHRDLPGVKKTCPGFSVRDWLKDNGL